MGLPTPAPSTQVGTGHRVTGETQGRHRGQGGYFTPVYTECVGAGAGILVASRVELEVLVGVSQPQILQHNPIVMVEGDKVGWQYSFYIIIIDT